MPVAYKEVIPPKLLEEKSRSNNGERVPYTLACDIRNWMKDNIENHWFISSKLNTPGRVPSLLIILNFTNENDALAFKLAWL